MTYDAWVLVAVVLAAAFGFLSFLNTLGMHLAVRELRVRVVRILGRIEKAMDDPVGYAVPIIEKGIQRLNDDKEFRAHIGGAVTYLVTTAKAAVLKEGPPEVDKDGKPIARKRGVIGMVGDLMGLAQTFGFLKPPKV